MSTLYFSKKIYVSSALILSLSMAYASQNEKEPSILNPTPSNVVDLTGEEDHPLPVAIVTNNESDTVEKKKEQSISFFAPLLNLLNPYTYFGVGTSEEVATDVEPGNLSIQPVNSVVSIYDSSAQAQSVKSLKVRDLKGKSPAELKSIIDNSINNLADSVVIIPSTFSTLDTEDPEEGRVLLPRPKDLGQPKTIPEGFTKISLKEKETIYAKLLETLKSGKGNLETASIYNRRTYTVVNYNPLSDTLSQKVMKGKQVKNYLHNLKEKYNRGQHGYNNIEELK